MSLYTNFPAQNPFYGGINLTWGTGEHEDEDDITKEVEIIKPDYFNRIEFRIQRMERVVNQLEHELLYPGGRISTSGTVTEQVPSSGNWYLSTRLDLMASGVNKILEILHASGTLVSGEVTGYPFHVGQL